MSPDLALRYPVLRNLSALGKTEDLPIRDPLQVIDSTELAKRLNVPESWVRSRSNRKRTSDPIPHYKLGRYIRFNWGSRELADWLDRQLVSANRAGSKI